MNVFDNKEQLYAFKNKWKELYKEGFHKAKKYPIYRWDVAYKTPDEIIGYIKLSDMDAAFHLTHAIAVGKDLSKGFGKASNHKLGAKMYYSFSGNPCRATKEVFNTFAGLFTPEQQVTINKRMEEFIEGLGYPK